MTLTRSNACALISWPEAEYASNLELAVWGDIVSRLDAPWLGLGVAINQLLAESEGKRFFEGTGHKIKIFVS